MYVRERNRGGKTHLLKCASKVYELYNRARVFDVMLMEEGKK